MKMGRPSSNDVARRIRALSSEGERSALIELLSSEPDQGRETLEGLARDRDPEIRHWVAEAASEVIGPDAVPILQQLVRDRDVDVRIDALTALVRVDPGEARRMIPTLEKRAKSHDFYEAQAAIWALGALGDTGSLDVIRMAQRQRDAIPRNAAIAVELLLTDPDELYRRIEEHDHDLMPWLVKAAELAGTPAAQRALERCASDAPDTECKTWASRALGRFKVRTGM